MEKSPRNKILTFSFFVSLFYAYVFYVWYPFWLSFCHFVVLQKKCPSEDLPDETFNRRAVLLKSVSMVMSCSPVCEKQALFALVQSYKENSIDEQLIKKVKIQYVTMFRCSWLYSIKREIKNFFCGGPCRCWEVFPGHLGTGTLRV